MTKKRQELIDEVLYQIQKDCDNRDVTAIEDLLKDVSNESLMSYLPEEIQQMLNQDEMINQDDDPNNHD